MMLGASEYEAWAQSLVGRDWEIFWNDELETDTKMDDNTAELDMGQTDFPSPIDAMEPEKEEKEDDASEGSVIDDWYAGKVLSRDDGQSTFKVLFVGDDEVYDMDLEPKKVRPSARGWIKRTKVLLCGSIKPTDEQEEEWDARLPPDTCIGGDQVQLNNLQNELNATVCKDLSFPDHKDGVDTPSQKDIQRIMNLRYLLRAQVYLRSRLATIVNLHGSVKVIDGEPNPTEPHVNHLTHCCEDLGRLCDWYCRCWELLAGLFGNTSNNVAVVTFDKLIDHYLEFGKSVIVECATMNADSTTSKRRILTSPTSNARRTKRRRKIARWGNGVDHVLDSIADEGDLRSTVFVDQFVRTLLESTGHWAFAIFGRMLQTLSHFVVDPVVIWKRKASQVLGDKDQSDDVPEVDASDPNEGEQLFTGPEDEGSASSSEEQQHYFSLDEVESCLKAIETNPVLKLLDMSEDEGRLKTKLTDIESLVAKAVELLRRLAEDTAAQPKNDDEVLSGLRVVQKSVFSKDHSMFNIEPIGRAASPLTRELLAAAIEIRCWFIGVKHVLVVRERCAFIQNLAQRMSQLPHLVDFPGFMDFSDVVRKRDEAEGQVEKISKGMAASNSLSEKYWTELHEQNRGHLLSKEAAIGALDELSQCPTIALVEELIALRVDVLAWNEEATVAFETKGQKIEYTRLERLYDSLHLVSIGKSQTRMDRVKMVESNEEVERAVRSFASRDSKSICGQLVERVNLLFARSSQWKERADSIISTLRMHGNPSAGKLLVVQKLPGMVDIKRINDLVAEYDALQVELPGYTPILQSVEADSIGWSLGLKTTIMNAATPLDSCLTFLEAESEHRPRGIIMNPTRHVLDSLLDMLGWHKRVKEAVRKLKDDVSKALQKDGPGSSVTENYSSFLIDTMYPLLVEGTDVVEVYARSSNSRGSFKANSLQCAQVLEELYSIRRTARALSREKLESHDLGSSILSRMVRTEEDLAEGLPLFVMLWTHWHVSIAEFVALCEETSDEVEVRHESPFTPCTLLKAKELKSQRPIIPSAVNGSSSVDILMLVETQTSELVQLDRVIEEAEKIESEIRELLYKSREMLKASIQKTDLVRQHLIKLKENLLTFKDRASGEGGLSLSPTIEPQLEHHIKIFTWLVRTFSYSLLHLDEASYSAPVNDDGDEASRVPWNVLVGLYDKIPFEVEERSGDFALVSLRVRELYEAAKKWQDEITRSTMLSIRGGKRRGPSTFGTGSPPKSEPDQEASSKLQMENMKQLAENPILSKVAMPREGAVNGIVQNSNEFEVQLHDFLGQDYEGSSPDRAAFPESHSLTGKKGEFILFRLTGGLLYESMRSSIHNLSVVAANVFAETPGKTAFDWIRVAVSWIERLSDAVSKDSPFEVAKGSILVIPGKEAREILKKGESIFLHPPEDLKKTLSQHGIFVSTNKQGKTLRVILKKDGAHHSVGGTVIRWCPILFDSLRADVARLDEWERELTRILTRFNVFFSETKNDEKHLYRWFCFREQVAGLLNDGAESLVVSPQQGLVNSFQNLLNSIQNFLKLHSKPELDIKFARKWFAQSTSLLDDRFLLLESVLLREAAFDTRVNAKKLPNVDESEKNFRDICRTYIERSLNKSLKMIGMTPNIADAAIEPADLESFSAIKAWEIENEMFEKFQSVLRVSRVSEDYRNKARSLRVSLEDRHNISLCLRILIGDISADSLVSMTSEQLASQKAKLDRARAAKAALSSALLTPEIKDSASDTTSKVVVKSSPTPPMKKQPDMPKKGVAPLLRSVLRRSNDFERISPVKRDDQSVDPSKPLRDGESAVSRAAESVLLSSPGLSENSSSPAVLKVLRKPASKISRPPPPPSLVKSFQQPVIDNSAAALAASSKDRGQRVTNSIGGDRFRIEINNLRLAFYAAFYLEDESQIGVHRFLEDTLAEKGRLKIDEFSRFLSEKLSSGRWVAIPLRLTTISDQDAKDYKKFYKEYELKKRIAMFSVNQNSKMFLVTPKFHGAAKGTGYVSLSNKTSTYAIVLTKDVGVLMD